MTKLEAVNEVLQAVGEGPVEELDTGGDTVIADAERILDQESRRVQSRGWAANTEHGRTLHVATHRLAVTGEINDGLLGGELIEGQASGATGRFLYQHDGVLWLHRVSGTFQSGETVIGQNSGDVGRAAGAAVRVSAARISIPFGVGIGRWLRVTPADQRPIALRGGFLFDSNAEGRVDPDDGYLFDRDVTVDLVTLLELHDLTDKLRTLVIKSACLKLQRFVQGDGQDDQFAQSELAQAWVEAKQESLDMGRPNILSVPLVARVKGHRRRWL